MVINVINHLGMLVYATSGCMLSKIYVIISILKVYLRALGPKPSMENAARRKHAGVGYKTRGLSLRAPGLTIIQ